MTDSRSQSPDALQCAQWSQTVKKSESQSPWREESASLNEGMEVEPPAGFRGRYRGQGPGAKTPSSSKLPGIFA